MFTVLVEGLFISSTGDQAQGRLNTEKVPSPSCVPNVVFLHGSIDHEMAFSFSKYVRTEMTF